MASSALPRGVLEVLFYHGISIGEDVSGLDVEYTAIGSY